MKITKSDLNNGSVTLATSYVTNGHWAVRLDAVENAAMLNTVDKLSVFAPRATYINEIEDSKIEALFPESPACKVTFKGNILNQAGFDKAQDLVEYSDEEGNVKIYFNRRYAEMLDIADTELLGKEKNGPFTDAKRRFLLMPVEVK